MAAKTAEELAAHAALNNHQAPHDPEGRDDDAMDDGGDADTHVQSYAQVAAQIKKLEFHLAREDKANDFYVDYAEVAQLVFKRLRLPEGKLISVDNTLYKKLVIEIDGDVDISELNLTQALEIRKGLKTKPLQSPDTDYLLDA